MLHDWTSFGDEIATLLKKSGDSGDSGDKSKNRNSDNGLRVPTSRGGLSPLQNEWGQSSAGSGDNNLQDFQPFAGGVPTVSTVPTNFAEGAVADVEAARDSRLAHSKSQKLPDGLPADWRAGFAVFCVMPSPEDVPTHRWQQAVHDGFAFLSTWGMDAARLGWSVTDLFGASPTAPWSRVGMLGLIPLLNGDTVVALDTDAATIETGSGSRLRYRRHIANDGRVCLWEIGGVK
jgi:hypothetical protein